MIPTSTQPSVPRAATVEPTPRSRRAAPIPTDRLHAPGRSHHLALRFAARDAAMPPVALEPGQVTLVEGIAGLEPVRHRLLLDCAARGRSVLHVIGGNRLDSAGLARRAQARGLDPGYALRSSTVARAFTAHQLSVLLEETLPDQLAREDRVALAWISDPLALYTDEDVHQREAELLAEQAAAALSDAACDHGRPVVLVQPPPTERAHLLERLREHAHTQVRVQARPTASPGASRGGAERIVEHPGTGRRYRVADPQPRQARLDRFLDAGTGRGRARG